MLVINLFGGPGCGKSTTAAAVFALLKLRGHKAEYVPEFAKDLVWEGRSLDDQVYILGEQNHRLERLVGEVDIAVTDAPIMLSAVYSGLQGYDLGALALHLTKYHSNLNFILERKKPYQQYGREQTEDQARDLDRLVRHVLNEYGVPYSTVPGNRQGIREVLRMVESVAVAQKRYDK